MLLFSFLNYKEDQKQETTTTSTFNQINLEKISPIVRRDFPTIVVEQMLNAIRLNSYEARQRFPRLLQIISLYQHTDVAATFIDRSRSIPSWMFLGWLSQMTAILDKPEASAIHHILETICVEYPQAFIYPFKMSLDQMSHRSEQTASSEFVERLNSRMSGHMQIGDQFVSALEQLACHPVHLFNVR